MWLCHFLQQPLIRQQMENFDVLLDVDPDSEPRLDSAHDIARRKKEKKAKKRKELESSGGGHLPKGILAHNFLWLWLIRHSDVSAKGEKKRKRSEDSTTTESTSKKHKKKEHKDKDIPNPPSTVPTAVSTRAPTPSLADQKTFLEKHSITIHSALPIVPILSFSQLSIDPRLCPAFEGFSTPTPIQACTWPPVLEGKDVIGIAETGR
jgi:ATP-dependent RNA helicase DBP3